MTSPHDDLDRLIAEFGAQREQLVEAQGQMEAARVSVTSARNVLTVTLGPAGEIDELTFNNRDYRTMGPEDLAKLVRDTIEEARTKLTEQMHKAMGGLLGGGNEMFGDLLSGNVDWQKMFPADMFDGIYGGARPDGDEGARR